MKTVTKHYMTDKVLPVGMPNLERITHVVCGSETRGIEGPLHFLVWRNGQHFVVGDVGSGHFPASVVSPAGELFMVADHTGTPFATERLTPEPTYS